MSLSPYPSAMERVLFNLHHQMCTQALRKSSARSRSLLENALLVLAVSCFGVLLLAHLSFVYRGGPYSTMPTPVKASLKYKIPSTCLQSISGFVTSGVDVTHLSIMDDTDDDEESAATPQSSFVYVERRTSSDMIESIPEGICNAKTESFTHNMTRTIFSFSQTKGYLLLSPATCRDRNLTVQHVVVSKSDVRCFGEPFLQTIVHQLTTPETVMINWILGHSNAASANGPYFVYNPRTDTIIDLEQQFYSATSGEYYHYYSDYHLHSSRRPSYYSNRQIPSQHLPPSLPWHRPILSKLAVVVKTSFLFFTTTTLISFTLRVTQERMLDFTHQLQVHVGQGQSVWSLVVTHLLENLVFVPQMIGLCFFLTEFYHGDKLLAFMVLSLVWVCEVFSVISLRSAQGLHFFPRIFFLLFSLFHYYLFSFPFGFSYTALASTVLFMAHSMLYFWHRYELPALAHGHVTLSNPRMNNNSNSNNYNAFHHQAQSQPSSIPILSSADRRTNGRSAVDVPAPHINLSPRVQQHQYTIVRQPSQTSTSNSGGFGSRQAGQGGSSVLFHRGSTDEDDRDESYLFFMNGEVVMHRRPPSSASLRSGISSIQNDDGLSHGGDEIHSVGSFNSIQDALETSALQAIMEVGMQVHMQVDDYNETPRIENLSRRFEEDIDGRTCSRLVPPDFPDPDTDSTME